MTIGITAGAFDLLHPGHLVFFKQCRIFCNSLTICLQTDPSVDRPEKNKPAESMYERWMRLDNCSLVDKIIPYDTEEDLLNLLKTEKWDQRFLDTEYTQKRYTGDAWRKEDHTFIPRLHNWSSGKLRERIVSAGIRGL